MTAMPRQAAIGAVLAVAVCVAGCADGPVSASAGASPTTAPSSTPAAPIPTPVPVPTSPAGGAGEPGAGGGSQPGNPGGDGGPGTGGGVVPIDPGGLPQPEPTLVTPVAGLMDVHPVGAVRLDPSLDGRHLSVRVAWWSGVEPCNVLAGVDVVRDGSTFTLTVREGSAARGVACIEIAMYKATIVDLGQLDAGDYTVTAFGEAPPLSVTIPG